MISCVDLFAGAGGFSLAAQNVGLTVKVAVEKNSHACNSYRSNLIKNGSDPTLYKTDILELSPKIIFEKHFKGNNNCDIVLGGPPCQGFSVHRIKDSGVGDPRNELILRYFEFVSVLRPKVFLMENVPGILWPRHEEYLREFYDKGKKTGYLLKPPIILDARNFGVPQRRKRVFILGIRKDVRFNSIWPPNKTHSDKKTRKKNTHLKPWVTANKVFSDPLSSDDENNLHMNHTPKLIEVFKSTPLNGGSRSQSNRVWKHCKALGTSLDADIEILIAGAYFHDLGRHHIDAKAHGALSSELAKPILEKIRFPSGKIENVLHAIRVHDGTATDQDRHSIESKILFDSDKLDSFGKVEVTRNILVYFGKKSIDYILSDLDSKWIGLSLDETRKYAERDYNYTKDFFKGLEQELTF